MSDSNADAETIESIENIETIQHVEGPHRGKVAKRQRKCNANAPGKRRQEQTRTAANTRERKETYHNC